MRDNGKGLEDGVGGVDDAVWSVVVVVNPGEENLGAIVVHGNAHSPLYYVILTLVLNIPLCFSIYYKCHYQQSEQGRQRDPNHERVELTPRPGPPAASSCICGASTKSACQCGAR